MRGISCFAAFAALFLAAASASAATMTFDFEDGTDQGWGTAFGGDGDASHAIVDIGGSKRMLLNLGGFQVGSIASGANPYLAAVNTAVANPGLSTISYDWYVDTTGFTAATFLQLGTYLNAGQPPFPYTQDFPGTGKDVELSGDQLASGGVFSGTVTETLTAKGYDLSNAAFQNAPSHRFGIIMNGNGTGVKVYFDNITINGVPEPATLALLGLVVPALLVARRRRS